MGSLRYEVPMMVPVWRGRGLTLPVKPPRFALPFRNRLPAYLNIGSNSVTRHVVWWVLSVTVYASLLYVRGLRGSAECLSHNASILTRDFAPSYCGYYMRIRYNEWLVVLLLSGVLRIMPFTC